MEVGIQPLKGQQRSLSIAQLRSYPKTRVSTISLARPEPHFPNSEPPFIKHLRRESSTHRCLLERGRLFQAHFLAQAEGTPRSHLDLPELNTQPPNIHLFDHAPFLLPQSKQPLFDRSAEVPYHPVTIVVRRLEAEAVGSIEIGSVS